MYNIKDFNRIESVINESIVTCEPTLIGNMFVASTGIFLKSHDSSKKFVGGFSCKKTEKEALNISRYECKERVLSMFDLRLDKSPSILMKSYLFNKDVKSVLFNEMLINNKNNAVGLSIHQSSTLAIEHSINEVIERAILGKIFYQNEKLSLLGEESIDGHKFQYLTLKRNPFTGFVMAVLKGNSDKFITLGACRSSNINLSIEKAKSEAIMLADNILKRKEIRHLPSDIGQKRMQSQEDPYSIEIRSNFIKDNTINTVSPCFDVVPTDDVIKFLGGDISYCTLFSNENITLIRSVPVGIPSLFDLRKKFFNTKNFLIDFVC
jgi:hypothetical protein